MAKKTEPKFLKKLPPPFNRMTAKEFGDLTITTPEISLNQKASYALFNARKFVPIFSKIIYGCFFFSLLCLLSVFFVYFTRPSPLLIASYPDGRLNCVAMHSNKDQGIRQKLSGQEAADCEAIESLKDVNDMSSNDDPNQQGGNNAK
jgi:hypothetical protein